MLIIFGGFCCNFFFCDYFLQGLINNTVLPLSWILIFTPDLLITLKRYIQVFAVTGCIKYFMHIKLWFWKHLWVCKQCVNLTIKNNKKFMKSAQESSLFLTKLTGYILGIFGGQRACSYSAYFNITSRIKYFNITSTRIIFEFQKSIFLYMK